MSFTDSDSDSEGSCASLYSNRPKAIRSASSAKRNTKSHSTNKFVNIPLRESDSSLETLPPELRHKILFMLPDLPSLHSLVHASPALHAQYSWSREVILRNCLRRSLQEVYPDAIAAFKSRTSEILPPRTDDKIATFINLYSCWLSNPSECPSLETLGFKAVKWLARFHLFVATPLSQELAQWAMSNMGKEDAINSSRIDAANRNGFTLSSHESCRVFRAIYRHHTYHHLFGVNDGQRLSKMHNALPERYLSIFRPWERETVASFDVFVRDFYQRVFDEVEWDLSDENSKFLQPNGFNPSGSMFIKTEGSIFMNGTVSRGLKIMMKFFRARNNHELLVSKTQRCLTYPNYQDRSLEETLENFDYYEESHQNGDVLGEGLPTGSGCAGWQLAWKSISPLDFEGDIPVAFRKWAYTIWDDEWWQGFDPVPMMHVHWKETNDALNAMIEGILSRPRLTSQIEGLEET